MPKPRATPEAKQRVILVRLDGHVHSRLCELRERTGRSINQLVVDAIHRILPLPIVANPEPVSELPEMAETHK